MATLPQKKKPAPGSKQEGRLHCLNPSAPGEGYTPSPGSERQPAAFCDQYARARECLKDSADLERIAAHRLAFDTTLVGKIKLKRFGNI
jgi:hypothetical protein